jgi:ATP-dependent helicase/nuclease subunit A
MDLAAPAVSDDFEERVRIAYPAAGEDELALIRSLVDAYCSSDLAARVGSLDGVAKERHFTFEHDGVLLHGFLDVYHQQDGEALVVDYKSNALGDETPEDIVERSYRLQRLVYALACFRAGAERVEVVYQFLERPDAPLATTFVRDEIAGLEAELSAAIEHLRRGEFRPTPSEFACAGCPALDLVCAGPRLPAAFEARPAAIVG